MTETAGSRGAPAATGPRRPTALACGGAAAMFLVQPPADLWLLAWLAPAPWVALVAAPVLSGRRPWGVLWAAGFLHWLATIHWLRLPHPATSIGWIALSAYLACYLPAFVWLARRLVHGRGWPLVPAATVAWVATEQLRGSVLGGFTFAALAYGGWRLLEAPPPRGEPLDVLLVQGSIDTELKHDPAAAGDVVRHYDALTQAGLAATPGRVPDLVVWPETMWRFGLLEIDPNETLEEPLVEQVLGPAPAGSDATERATRQARCRTALERERLDGLAAFARRYGTTWLVGLDKQVLTPRAPAGSQSFNCGLFVAADGAPLACYAKMHPVMFGEYVPFAERFPFLYRLTPLPGGLTAGRAPVAVTLAGQRVAVNICYETTLPEAVRSLVNTLAAGGARPDVLVNLTNDGWFWGSSELDMHLTAAVFRAVEVRTPIVIAANTGFSAWIDGSGRLLDRGPRRATATLRALVRPDGRTSPWLVAGSLAAWGCVAVAGAVTLGGLVGAAVARSAGDRA